jgi:DUF4097 and DUF4098 domain-containing protein YvlB
MQKSIFVHVFALLLIVPAAFLWGADRKFEKKFTVAGGGTLTLRTDVGSVRVEGTSDKEVSVLADLHGREKDINSFEITAEQSSGGVDVQGKGARRNSWFWNSVDLDIRYTVRVPHEYNLRLNTSGGDIDVKLLKGTVRGETSGGNISIAEVEGGIEVHTSGGSINAGKITGDLHMETSGGDIVIASVVGAVDVSTSGGNIKMGEVDGKVHAETSGGDVAVRVKGGNRGVYAETSGGNIEIMIGKNVPANIDASTSGGEVVCDLPVTVTGKIDESRVRGIVNGGGNTIHAHTSGGDVHIRALD